MLDKLSLPNISKIIADAIISVVELKPDELHKYHLITFPQTWGSTALGFPRIGGSTMCTANTTVLYSPITKVAVVAFADELAYKVSPYNEEFYEDLMDLNLDSVKQAEDRYGAIALHY